MKILQARYTAELDTQNFDMKKFNTEWTKVKLDHKDRIMSNKPTISGGYGDGDYINSPVGADAGPIGPINRNSAFLDKNTISLYNTLAGGLVKAKMEYRFVHHLRRNDTLNSGFVSEKMILNAFTSTYKEC